MAMIKRAVTGKIKESMNKDSSKSETLENINHDPQDIVWNDVVIKDVLNVPTISPHNIDVDLDEEDGDEIAIRV